MNVVDTGPESPQSTPRERAESEFGPAGSDPELPRTLLADGWFELPAEPRRILAWIPVWRNFLPAWGIILLLWVIVEMLVKGLRGKRIADDAQPDA